MYVCLFVMCGCFGNMYSSTLAEIFLTLTEVFRVFHVFSSVVRQMPG